MLVGLLFAAIAVAVLFPRTPPGRFLHRLLVELPAQILPELTFGRAIIGLVILTAAAALVAVAKRDGLTLAAQALPDSVAWFAAFDLAAFVDVAVVVWLLAAAVRFRALYQVICFTIERTRELTARCTKGFQRSFMRIARSRSGRTQGSAPRSSKENDGDRPLLGWAFAVV